MTKQEYPHPTVGALIFDPDGRLFLMKSHKWHGKYVVPGGHIELGETIEEALNREVKEETNLDVFDVEFLLYQDFLYDDAFWKNMHFVFFDFSCRTNSPEVVVLNEEASEFTWAHLDRALKMAIDPYTRTAILEYQKRFT
ncbi:MAG: NUDIX domain-containing protein [Anaerolineales bacterium]|nr:NUDIX domain-containing protein [Chloroflexota bacterium]MBL6981381.1 NUDIX domain-containing protein [Anaerolineales bacterium]